MTRDQVTSLASNYLTESRVEFPNFQHRTEQLSPPLQTRRCQLGVGVGDDNDDFDDDESGREMDEEGPFIRSGTRSFLGPCFLDRSPKETLQLSQPRHKIWMGLRTTLGGSRTYWPKILFSENGFR